MARKLIGAIVPLCLSLAGMPAAAQLRLPPAADASERALLPEIGQLLGGDRIDLKPLDAMLLRLPRPTPLRGVVQLTRAIKLAEDQRNVEAIRAADEAVRLLPDQPGAKFLLSALLTFTDRPRQAADLWLAASRQAPDLARDGDRYTINALVGRLVELGDPARAEAIQVRMAEIGLAASLTSERSDAAVAQVHRAMAANDVDAAMLAIADVVDPDELRKLMVDRRYAALWPVIERTAGASLGDANKRYFTALRREWQQSRNFETATSYARALAKARRYDVVVTLFLPLFDRPAGDADPHVWFLAPVVARSLTEIGREAEARALLERLAISGDGAGAMRLNATGNLANLAHLQRHWETAATQSAAWLMLARPLGPEVNRSAVLAVAALNACALTNTGRAEAASESVGDLLMEQRTIPDPAMTYRLCTGNAGVAAKLIIDRLDDEASRPWALEVVQPAGPGGNLPEEIAEHNLLEQIRRDPAVRAAATKVGRILPEATAVGLPAGFDPFAIDPIRQPGPDSV